MAAVPLYADRGGDRDDGLGVGDEVQAVGLGRSVVYAAAVIGVYLPDAYLPLLTGFAMIGGYLVPGYLLKSARENEKKV